MAHGRYQNIGVNDETDEIYHIANDMKNIQNLAALSCQAVQTGVACQRCTQPGKSSAGIGRAMP